MGLERGVVLKNQVIPLKKDLVLVVRRIARLDRELIDIRFAGRGEFGHLRFTKKGIRIWAEQLDDLIEALMGVRKIEVERPPEIEVASA